MFNAHNLLNARYRTTRCNVCHPTIVDYAFNAIYPPTFLHERDAKTIGSGLAVNGHYTINPKLAQVINMLCTGCPRLCYYQAKLFEPYSYSCGGTYRGEAFCIVTGFNLRYLDSSFRQPGYSRMAPPQINRQAKAGYGS